MSSHSHDLLQYISVGWKPNILVHIASDLESMYFTAMLFWTINICKYAIAASEGDNSLVIISDDMNLSCASEARWSPNRFGIFNTCSISGTKGGQMHQRKATKSMVTPQLEAEETALWTPEP